MTTSNHILTPTRWFNTGAPINLTAWPVMDSGIPRPAGETRYDYFLIWGHGLPYRDEILDIVRNEPTFDILRIEGYKSGNIARFVRQVYGCDTVPLEHLRTKTQYLLTTDPDVCIIFIRNRASQEEVVGEGEYRHVQCANIRRVKELIRDKFNPYTDGRRSENHVIHASDTESQVDHLLRLNGKEGGLKFLTTPSNRVLNTPGHLAIFKRFRLRFVDARRVLATVLDGDIQNPTKSQKAITATPHYAYLTGNRELYERYWKRFSQSVLVNDHSPTAFDALAKDFDYLATPYENDYIVLRETGDGWFIIQDGLHRAALLQHQGYTRWIAAITK